MKSLVYLRFRECLYTTNFVFSQLYIPTLVRKTFGVNGVQRSNFKKVLWK